MDRRHGNRRRQVGRFTLAPLHQLVGQGSAQGVAGHRFGEDALDPRIARDDLAWRIADAGEHDQQNVVVQARVFLDLGR
uniref:Uncharacterized protein n=1 Tax=Tanacetum cinerariifolium TaxID=118510 RepID=A0A699X2U9_TANCI|nr:hypothetical protein [Tanacetum cinerariifolium]